MTDTSQSVARTSNANDDTWENNAKYLLERCPHTVRVREGGGPENLMHSFIHTFMAMEQKLRGSHETLAALRVYTHVKTGNQYEVLHDATETTNGSREGRGVVVYRRIGQTAVYVREATEFHEKFVSSGERNAQKAGEQRHGAAQDFVSFDPQGGVWIDMARYLRSPAGQAQLQALGGKKASEQCAIDANALADAHRMYEAEHGHPFSESEPEV